MNDLKKTVAEKTDDGVDDAGPEVTEEAATPEITVTLDKLIGAWTAQSYTVTNDGFTLDLIKNGHTMTIEFFADGSGVLTRAHAGKEVSESFDVTILEGNKIRLADNQMPAEVGLEGDLMTWNGEIGDSEAAAVWKKVP